MSISAAASASRTTARRRSIRPTTCGVSSGSCAPTGLSALIEPGRVIVGPAGSLLTRIVDIKHVAGARQFVVLDAGMTELMRPALYQAFHRIDPVRLRSGPSVTADIVGPICESTDTFGRDRELPPVEVGDLMVIHDAGAYGAAMGSTYLRRPLPPEVLVDNGRWRVIRRRQTLDDMLRLEDAGAADADGADDADKG